jgi:hypothetical protein
LAGFALSQAPSGFALHVFDAWRHPLVKAFGEGRQSSQTREGGNDVTKGAKVPNFVPTKPLQSTPAKEDDTGGPLIFLWF